MLNEIKPRVRELQKIWKPVGLVISVVSALGALKEFHRRAGQFFPGSLLLLVLSVAILYTVPIRSIRLFADRLVAFVVDLAILTLFTYAVIGLLFKFQALQPSAVLSMGIIWAWFFVFVLFDWRFAGTPGKLIVGLRLKNTGSRRNDFIKCLLRNLLILVVPLAIAGRMTAIPANSRTTSFVLWTTGLSLLSFLPLSIAFSGGQSIPDLLLGTAVLPRGFGLNQYPASLNRREWVFLVLASLLAGIILAYTSFPGLGGRRIEFKSPTLPTTQVTRSGETEARIAAGLRPQVLKELPNPDLDLEDFEISSALGELPSATYDETPAALACLNSFNMKKGYLIVHARISSETPNLVKALLFQNLFTVSAPFIDRPGYLVFQISSRETFGVFDFEYSENYVLCLTESTGRPERTLVGGGATIYVPFSLQMPALLILGDLGRYAAVENVPIWPTR